MCSIAPARESTVGGPPVCRYAFSSTSFQNRMWSKLVGPAVAGVGAAATGTVTASAVSAATPHFRMLDEVFNPALPRSVAPASGVRGGAAGRS